MQGVEDKERISHRWRGGGTIRHGDEKPRAQPGMAVPPEAK